MQPIFLIGFMGTGKSITGKKIAYLLGLNYVDLDSYIEEKYNMKINQLFSEFGEDKFREYESLALKEISNIDTIVSCGGGTPCFNDNLNYINSIGISIYLKTNRGILISRLIHNKSKRPLLNSKTDSELIIYINELLDKREPFYNKAHHTFQIDKKRIQDLIDLIQSNDAIA